MNTSALASYRELENVDLLRDLDARSLHVTADGFFVARRPAIQPAGLPVGRPLYYMALTRELDREIVKMLRKGLALGKNLMCTGHEAIAVGACAANAARGMGRACGPRPGRIPTTIVADIARTSFESLDAPIQLVAAADTPVPFSPVLEAVHLPTTGKLVKALRELLAY